MTTAIPMPRNTASTFLTHFFGGGLKDGERYVVERFRACVNGDIRRCRDDNAPKSGRRRTKLATATPKAVRAMQPERNEIIICTGLSSKGGVQYWGVYAMGLGLDRRQRG